MCLIILKKFVPASLSTQQCNVMELDMSSNNVISIGHEYQSRLTLWFCQGDGFDYHMLTFSSSPSILCDSHCLTFADNGPQPPGPPSANKGSVTAWVIVGIAGVVILVLLLVVALAYFVIRHQQLQRSFMSFANSHYDTRSGTATFNPEENTTDLGKSNLLKSKYPHFVQDARNIGNFV